MDTSHVDSMKELSDVCRSCLCEAPSGTEGDGGHTQSVMGPIHCQGQTIHINQLIMQLCNVQISADDILPKVICDKCVEDVRNTFKFKLKCEKAHNVLLEYKASYLDKDIQFTIKEEYSVNDDDDNDKCDISQLYIKMEDDPHECLEEMDILSDLEEKVKKDVKIKAEDFDGNNSFNKASSRKSKTYKKRKRKHSDDEPCMPKKKEIKCKVTIKTELCCDKCSFKTRSPAIFRRHSYIHVEKKTYCCRTCGHTTKSASSFKNHMLEHGDDRPFKCEKCDFTTRDPSNLRRHQDVHSNVKPFACEFCSYRAARSETLEEHTRKHTGVKPYLCDQCDYRCSSKGCLRAHRRNKHSDEKKFFCNECPYKAKTKNNIVIHLQTHTGDRRFACDQCDYKAYTLAPLQNHIRAAHTGERPFSCDKCTYTATNASLLKTHMRIHYGIRNFKCPHCNLSFYTKHRLNNHVRSHTGVKPHICNLCEFKSACQSSLRRHERNIHQLKPYKSNKPRKF